MEKARVAIIGAGQCLQSAQLKSLAHGETGPSGLSMLKQLREDGFTTALFERRSRVGGLWAYSEDKQNTTALPSRCCVAVRGLCPADGLRRLTRLLGTRANISKFICGFSDYPMPDRKCPDQALLLKPAG
jgi:dimethylaniline monooxygenase (N-oxide forming)